MKIPPLSQPVVILRINGQRVEGVMETNWWMALEQPAITPPASPTSMTTLAEAITYIQTLHAAMIERGIFPESVA